MIEQAKQQTQLFRDAAVQQVKNQMEKEKQEVGNSSSTHPHPHQWSSTVRRSVGGM